MSVLETALESFSFLGLEWDESSQKLLYSIKKQFISQFLGVLCIISTLIFLTNDAKTFLDYTEALFICSTAVMCNLIYIIFYIKLNELSEFTKISKSFVGERKRTDLFNCINLLSNKEWIRLIYYGKHSGVRKCSKASKIRTHN